MAKIGDLNIKKIYTLNKDELISKIKQKQQEKNQI